jgi:hypothetical protein
MRRALTSTTLVVLPALGLALQGRDALAWGPATHQKVTLEAMETLPKGLKPFYQNHRLEMPSLELEAKPALDAEDRRFAVDRLLPFPFADLPHREAEFKARFPADAEATGRLPWLILESYDRLVEAFRSGDKTKILAESDLIAALVADLHNPLALTQNADGQKTGQHGLWVRFSVRLPEGQGKDLKLHPDAAHFLDDPREHVFSMINGTYVWLDNLLYQEELARRGQSGYTELYYQAFAARAREILRERLSRAACEVGSYWYSAWTKAGRPELK